MIRHILNFMALLSLIYSPWAFSQGEKVDYSQVYSSSEAAGWFFGPARTVEQQKKAALNIGRVNVRVKTTLQCGKLNLSSSIQAGLTDMRDQLSSAANQLRGMLTNGGVVIAVVCYYKPNICAHVRHFTAMLQEDLNLQFNSCNAMDTFINEQADKGAKEVKAQAFSECMASKNNPSALDVKTCQSAAGSSLNLLAPFNGSKSNGIQKVLGSLLTYVNKSENYELWSKVLGEIELKKDGYWVRLFPKDLLRAEDVVVNIAADAKQSSCNTADLRKIIQDQASGGDDYSKFVRRVIKENIAESIVKDLESMPAADRAMGCQALADSIAKLAVKRAVSEGRSDMAAALTNPALPTDLRTLYGDQSRETFKTIEERSEVLKPREITDVLQMIAKLGSNYRKLNHEAASDISVRKEQ
ncbi:MAG: hypothetical protein EOP04_03610 [Proteobacteria bacterium]|nr:MAG: hypothetical protein EOP04_03610 [Pseudomonadota bacterium]